MVAIGVIDGGLPVLMAKDKRNELHNGAIMHEAMADFSALKAEVAELKNQLESQRQTSGGSTSTTDRSQTSEESGLVTEQPTSHPPAEQPTSDPLPLSTLRDGKLYRLASVLGCCATGQGPGPHEVTVQTTSVPCCGRRINLFEHAVDLHRVLGIVEVYGKERAAAEVGKGKKRVINKGKEAKQKAGVKLAAVESQLESVAATRRTIESKLRSVATTGGTIDAFLTTSGLRCDERANSGGAGALVENPTPACGTQWNFDGNLAPLRKQMSRGLD